MSRCPTHELTLTEEQKTILSIAETGRDLVIMALAGTGKTTTVGLVAKSLGSRAKKGLYLAYNSEMKRTAVEKGFPAESSTIHGLAYKTIWIRSCGPSFRTPPRSVSDGRRPVRSAGAGARGPGPSAGNPKSSRRKAGRRQAELGRSE